jgi:hypothetical protein
VSQWGSDGEYLHDYRETCRRYWAGNLAAGTKAFRRGLREHGLVIGLTDLAKEAETRVTVAKRVEELSLAEIDSRYENRFDAALSAYLLVLSDTATPEIVAKAASAAAKAPNCWWTVGLSRELLMRAVATGFAEAPSARNMDSLTVLARRILTLLQTAQTKTQIPQVSNVMVLPPPTEEGELVIWKPRGRNRAVRKAAHAVASSSHPRSSRQAVRA